MTDVTIDQLLTSSTTAYALAYIEQVDGIEAMTREEIMDNLNALYGVSVPTLDVTTEDLREELRFQIDRDWILDDMLMLEILFWRFKNADIEVNEAIEYGHEWNLYGETCTQRTLFLGLETEMDEQGNHWRLNRLEYGPGYNEYNIGIFTWHPLIDAARIEAQ